MISPEATSVMLTSLHHGGDNGTVTRLVMHATVSPCQRGGAQATAHYFQSPNAGGAAHYTVDPDEAVCSVDETVVAYHAPPNHGSIGIELCDTQEGDGGRWQDADHTSMLALAARLALDICARHDLPLVWLSPDDLLAGKSGVTSHANVARAFRQTDHTDPGDGFPVDQFMALLGGQAAPKPAPAPVQMEDDMTFIVEFLDWPHKLWLVKAEPVATGNPDMANSAGTRKWINNNDRFWELAKLGIRVVQGAQGGGNQFKEVV